MKNYEVEILSMVKEGSYYDFRDYLNWLEEQGNIAEACALWYVNKFGKVDTAEYEWCCIILEEAGLEDAENL